MDLSDTCKLVGQAYTTDSIGVQTAVETLSEIYCQIESVTGSEFFEAGRNGIKAQKRVTVYADEYSGERIVELNGERFGVYRTFEPKNGMIELYLEEKAGV